MNERYVHNALYVQLSVLVAGIIVLASGFRPYHVGSDTIVYAGVYEDLVQNYYRSIPFEFFYEWLSRFVAWADLTVRGLFISVSAITFFFIFSSFYNFNVSFGKQGLEPDLYLTGLILLSVSVIFLSAQTNVIRHGVAAFALICFYSCLLAGNKKALLIISALVAIGFHDTSFLYLLLGAMIFVPHRGVVFIALAAALSYMVGLSEMVVSWGSAFIGIDVHGKIVEYGKHSQYRAGIRYDFALFSLGIGAVFELAARWLFSPVNRLRMVGCLKVYWILLLPFFAFGYGAYSDRLLFAAWLFSSFMAALVVSHGRFFYGHALRPLALWLAFICAVVYALSILEWLS